ncbi:hypothetical protein ACSSV6_002584 [Roseovarius sp. MBR-38]
MRIDRSPLTAALLVAVLTVALAAVGFAHRGGGLPDADYAAYLAAGGSAGDLCAHGGGAGDHAPAKHESGTNGCEACRIAAAMVLPEPGRAPDVWPRPVRAPATPAEAQIRPARLAHGLPQTRAPPRA